MGKVNKPKLSHEAPSVYPPKKPPPPTTILPSPSPLATPLADEALSQIILDMIKEGQEAQAGKVVKKGANEVTKSLNRGIAELVVLAADTEPVEILLHLPLVAEDKSCPYVFIASKAALGRACGLSRPSIAASITTSGNKDFRDKVEALNARVASLFV